MNLYQLLLGPLLDTLNPQKEHFAQEDSPSNPSNGPREQKPIRPYYEKLGDQPSIPASRPPSPTASARFSARTPSAHSAIVGRFSARTPSPPSPTTSARSSSLTPSEPSARGSSSLPRRSLKEKKKLTIDEVIKGYINRQNSELKNSEFSTLCADKAIELEDIKKINFYVRNYDRQLASIKRNKFIDKKNNEITVTVRNFSGDGIDLTLDSSNIDSCKEYLSNKIKENNKLYKLLEENGHYLNPENPPKRQEKGGKGR